MSREMNRAVGLIESYRNLVDSLHQHIRAREASFAFMKMEYQALQERVENQRQRIVALEAAASRPPEKPE